MNLGDIRSEFGNAPNEHEIILTVDGNEVEITEVSRENGIVGKAKKSAKTSKKSEKPADS